MPLKVYVGGYYFEPKNADDIRGVSTRLDIALNQHVNLIVSDSYDNLQHNTVALGVQFNFGGVHENTASPTLPERMLDPIHRNLATLGQGLGEPAVRSLTDGNKYVFEQGNIWFFNATGGNSFDPSKGTDQCTAGQPCAGNSFNQGNVDAINGIEHGVNFYFNPGTYDAMGNAAGVGANGGLQLNAGQSLYGRTQDYKLPAQGDQRALFIGGLDLAGDNTIDSIHLQRGNTFVTTGILANNAQNVVINNTEIGTKNFVGTTEYSTGINASGDTIITLNHSFVVANNNSDKGQANGIEISDAAQVALNNSTVWAIANGFDGYAEGIKANDDTRISIANSGIVATANGDNSGAVAVYAEGNSQTEINNSILLANANGDGNPGAAGVLANQNATVTINQSIIIATANGPNGLARGVMAFPSSAVNLVGSNQIVANALGANGTADPIDDLGGTINVDSSTECFKNGAQVPCLGPDKISTKGTW